MDTARFLLNRIKKETSFYFILRFDNLIHFQIATWVSLFKLYYLWSSQRKFDNLIFIPQ